MFLLKNKINTDIFFLSFFFFFFKNFVFVFLASKFCNILNEIFYNSELNSFFSCNIFLQKTNIFICFLLILKLILQKRFSFYNKYIILEILISISQILTVLFFIKTCSFMYSFFCFLAINFFVYALVFFNKVDGMKHETTIKYFYLSTISSCFLGYATWLIFDLFSNLNHSQVSCLLLNLTTFFLVYKSVFVILIFFSISFFFKLAIFPCHFGTPEIYKASNNNLVFFLGIPIKIIFFLFFAKTIKTAFFLTHSLCESFFLFSSIISLILGAVGAVYEKSGKIFFAYTSINQLGLIFMTTNFVNFQATSVYMYFFFVYFISSVLFFFCLGKIGLKTNRKQIIFIDQIYFFFKKKYSFYVMSICLFSLAGIPVFGGFYAKFLMFCETFADENYILLASVLSTSLISSFYYIAIIKKIGFDNKGKNILKKNNEKINGLLPVFCTILFFGSFFHCFFYYFFEKQTETLFF